MFVHFAQQVFPATGKCVEKEDTPVSVGASRYDDDRGVAHLIESVDRLLIILKRGEDIGVIQHGLIPEFAIILRGLGTARDSGCEWSSE